MTYKLIDLQEFYDLLMWYKTEAKKTCAPLDHDDHVLHMHAGIITESSELIDIYKKNFAYGKEIDKVHQSEEWADTMWYFANLLTDNNDLSQIIEFIKIPVMEINSRNMLFYLVNDMNRYINEFINEEVSIEYIIGKWLGLAYFMNIDFKQALKNNIEKLVQKRYKNKGFTSQDAIDRDLDSEHDSLSKGIK